MQRKERIDLDGNYLGHKPMNQPLYLLVVELVNNNGVATPEEAKDARGLSKTLAGEALKDE